MQVPTSIRQSRPWSFVERAAKKVFMPAPVAVRHAEYSMIVCADGAQSSPTERLFDVALAAIAAGRTEDLSFITARLKGRFRFPDNIPEVWPGEHYRLLAGLVRKLKPRCVVEIGTAEGMSALALKKNLSPAGNVVTFDIIPWRNYSNSCLEERDFDDGRLAQIVDDLGNPDVVERHRDLLQSTDLFFIDAAKDGVLERKLIRNLERLHFNGDPLVVFDDIRVWNMLAIWHELRWPKLDLTSFGHWSGTGLCEIRP